MKESFKIWAKRAAITSCSVLVVCLALYTVVLCAFPFPYKKINNIRYSKCVLDKNGQLLRVFTVTDDSWLMPVELNEVNPYFIKATLSIEDKRFMKHHGVDIFAAARAAKLNITNKKIISGASTISMQTIRLLEGRKRSFLNKVIEAVHAVRLETLYSKDRVLKLYFEIAPYGGNISGVKAASLRYFQKYPKDLTLAECALLAGLPQSPSRLRPDRHPERAKKRRDMVLFNMLKDGLITAKQYDKAKHEPVLVKVHPFPFNAPHFTDFINKRYAADKNVVTTLDSNIQHFAELTLKEIVEELRPQGVTNGAVVVIENATGKIRAMVGSSDFFSKEDSGQVNGALSKRCPGSTLKPFTYALGFDAGLYTPRMVLADVPVQYDGYSPLDYDKEFRGPVTVREALVESLNIPAVEVLDSIGYRKLYLFLKDAGISTLNKPPQYYGLALTLGSADVNLLVLTNAYAALARLGVYKPYHFIESDDLSVSKRILSEGACYLVSDILSDTKRLEAIGVYRDEKIRPKIAWKTGTSYGHKDAWTVAYNSEYTVGVWIGNFSARPAKVLLGVDVAAPLAVRIFDWIYAKRAAPWYKAPDSVGKRKVCAISGEVTGDICAHSVNDLYIKNVSIAGKCSVHWKIAVDNQTGLALDEDSARERPHTEKVFEVWPIALQSWFSLHNPEYVAPPRFLIISNKAVNLDKNKPKIISPSHKCEYFITASQDEKSKLALVATGSFDSDKLYWFIDSKLYNKCNIGERVFWDMELDRHKITCVDGLGRSSSIMVIVR